MKNFYLLLFLGSILTIGCAGTFKQTQLSNSQSHALVFGYIGTDKSPCYLDYIKYKQILPTGNDKYFSMRVDENLFYRECFDAPTSIQLCQFGGRPKVFSSITQCDISLPSDRFKCEIKEPGKLYFLGSYRAVQKDANLQDSKSVGLEVLVIPTELDVLQMLLPDVSGTPWEPIVKNEIQTLNNSPQKHQ